MWDIQPVYGPCVELIWDSLCPLYGWVFLWFWYVRLATIQTPYLCLSYFANIVFPIDTYFAKIHIMPMCGIDMAYGNGMEVERKPMYGKDMGEQYILTKNISVFGDVLPCTGVD